MRRSNTEGECRFRHWEFVGRIIISPSPELWKSSDRTNVWKTGNGLTLRLFERLHPPARRIGESFELLSRDDFNGETIMKIISAALISIAMAGGVFAAEQPVRRINAAMPVTQVDKATFVKMVLSSNKFEIDSSKLAVDKASSAEVKAFAEQMIADHTKAGEEFMATLKKEGQEPPAAELTPKHRDQLKQIEGAGNQDFDATYVSLQEAAHVEAVGLFRAYSEKPDDPALGEFAKKTLPTLEMHFDHVKKLAAAK